MSEPVPCPNCQTPLTLPAGATMIVCPTCHAELEVDPADAPPPDAPPITKPVPAAPLPFGRPIAPPPVARPVPPPAGKPVKARRAPADPDPDPPRQPTDPYAARTAGDEAAEAAARRRELRDALAQLDDEEERAEEREAELDQQCAAARLGLQLFAYAAAASAGAALLTGLFAVGCMSAAAIVPLALVAATLQAGHLGLLLAGFGVCLNSPREARGSALLGILLTVGHLLLAVSAAATLAGAVRADDLPYQANADAFLQAVLPATNMLMNLTLAADLPFYLQATGSPPPLALVVVALAAAMEFAKLSVLGLITNQFAMAGKDGTLGHQGLRFVYRVLSVVFVAPLVVGVVTATVPIETAWIPILFATVGFCLWWTFAWLALYQTLTDAREVVTTVRLLDTRSRLDTV